MARRTPNFQYDGFNIVTGYNGSTLENRYVFGGITSRRWSMIAGATEAGSTRASAEAFLSAVRSQLIDHCAK